MGTYINPNNDNNNNSHNDYSVERFERETGLVYSRNMETYRQWKLNKLINITSQTMARLNQVTDKIHEACKQHKRSL